MKFSLVADYFDQIEKTSGRIEITKLLAELLQKASPHDASIICNLSLGQLNPPYIGTQFNLAAKNVAKVIADLIDSNEKLVIAHQKKLGDLGLVVAEGDWQQKGDLTVLQVYKSLSHIEAIAGEGAQHEKNKALHELLRQLDPESAKYVVRIIIGKLRLGFSDMTIVDALSWMEAGDKSLRKIIEDAYNICVDIGLIAQTLKEDGIKAIEKMKIHMGIPIRPSAAERLPTAQAIIEKIGPSIAQPKLDGFRLQVHLDKTTKQSKVHFFSRNLTDMSSMFPDLKKAVEALPVEQLICEGEAIVYDPHTGTFLPFQETVKRKRKHGIEQAMQDLPLKLYLFDLLYLNGKELLTERHDTRYNKLVSLFKDMSTDVVQPIAEVEVSTAKQLEEYFNQNISAGLEGVVVKRHNAQYIPGKRNFNWIKLKRQEEGHLDDTIDSVVLGYYAGLGKRADFGIGAFLVGVYNKKEDRFETIAKIGTGLKDDEWRELKKKCDALAVKEKPRNVVCEKSLIPDVWVSPEIVCLVRADEITLSPVHAAGKTKDDLGFALRFPRFMGYRPDKSALEATTVHEIMQMYATQFAKQ